MRAAPMLAVATLLLALWSMKAPDSASPELSVRLLPAAPLPRGMQPVLPPAAPVQLAFVAPAASRGQPSAAEPPLWSAHRIACAPAPHLLSLRDLDAAEALARHCPFQPALRGTPPVGWVEFPVRFALETSSNG